MHGLICPSCRKNLNDIGNHRLDGKVQTVYQCPDCERTYIDTSRNNPPLKPITFFRHGLEQADWYWNFSDEKEMSNLCEEGWKEVLRDYRKVDISKYKEHFEKGFYSGMFKHENPEDVKSWKNLSKEQIMVAYNYYSSLSKGDVPESLKKAVNGKEEIKKNPVKNSPYLGEGVVTCKCGTPLNYVGIKDIDGDEKRASIVYHCKKCDKDFIGTSDTYDRNILKSAIEYAEAFNMRPVKELSKTKLELPKDGDALAYLGRIAGIIYKSEKEGELQTYVHSCGERDTPESNGELPHFAYYHGKNGKGCFIIWGGDMRIATSGKSEKHPELKGWLVD